MSNIEWTGETWNPILGCSKISAGCRNCYAVNQAFRNWKMALGLPEDKRGRLAYYEDLTEGPINWSGKIVFVPEALEIPLKRKKPQTYFVNSMSDMFHQNVENEWLDKIFAIMALTPQHTYQILTKRPDVMKAYFNDFSERVKQFGGDKWLLYDIQNQIFSQDVLDKFDEVKMSDFPLPNVWLGVSVENQKAAHERIPLLLDTPATVRFLSCEPLLENVDLTPYLPGIDWVIVGGESGHGSRDCNVDWLENITQQCLTANVPIFVKQMGANPKGLKTKLTDKKGGILEEFPESLQFRQMPVKNN